MRVITDDHRRVEEVFSELEATRGHFTGRKDLVDHAIAEMERHFAAEERFVYPDAARRLPEGEELVRHEMEGHGESEALMRELEAYGPEHPHFEQKLNEFIDSIRRHVEDEESGFLPKFESACSESELDDLGEKLEWAKSVTPTRPNPNSTEPLPEDRVLGPGPGFVDKIRSTLNQRTA